MKSERNQIKVKIEHSPPGFDKKNKLQAWQVKDSHKVKKHVVNFDLNDDVVDFQAEKTIMSSRESIHRRSKTNAPYISKLIRIQSIPTISSPKMDK